MRVPALGRAGDERRAAEQRRALAQAQEPVRVGLARILRREADAVVANAERQIPAVAPDGHLHARRPARASPRWRAIPGRCGTPRSPARFGSSISSSSIASSHGIPLRCVKVSASHSTAGTRPRSSSISGRRSAAMRRVAATVPSSSARHLRELRGGRRLASAATLCRAPRRRPSAARSAIARARRGARGRCRLFSCSRAACAAAPSSRSSSFDAPQRLLHPDALGDVAQDHRVELAAGAVELRDRRVDRKLLAVAAQPHDDAQRRPSGATRRRPRQSAARARGARSRNRSGMNAASGAPIASSRGQPNIASAAALNSTMRCAFVDGDDRVHRRIEDAARAAPRCSREPRLRVEALADVAQDDGERAGAPSARDAARCDASIGNSSAVGAQPDQHALPRPSCAPSRPCAPNRSTCARCRSRNRSGRSMSSGSPDDRVTRASRTPSPPRR